MFTFAAEAVPLTLVQAVTWIESLLNMLHAPATNTTTEGIINQCSDCSPQACSVFMCSTPSENSMPAKPSIASRPFQFSASGIQGRPPKVLTNPSLRV